MTEIKLEWEIKADLGEGPTWVERENALYWVDIKKNQVHSLHINTKVKKTWTFDTAVTSIIARKKSGFIGTRTNAYAYINLETESVQPIESPEKHLKGNRFNDGKLDSAGRYWAGTMDDKEEKPTGSLYCMDSHLSVKKMDSGYTISNGPAFSIDNKVMYHTDTRQKIVFAFDFDIKSGKISNKRKFVELKKEEEGSPDGMTIDSENGLWLCHFGGQRITRYSNEGKVIEVYHMPVPNITSCTFGGEQLDTLFITTARIHLSKKQLAQYPLSGSLFSCKPGVTGLQPTLFNG